MMESNAERARRIIAANSYLTLATSDRGGAPWAAPVYFAFDRDYKFYFVSARDSVHVQHLHANPRVAVAIFDSTVAPGQGDGVQIECEGRAATVGELPHILRVYFTRRFREREEQERRFDPRKYIKHRFLWFYVLTPIRAYVLDLESKEIDRRVEVDLRGD